MPVYYAHGKLLITAEYFVLDGAQALAVPTRQGQSLALDPRGHSGAFLHWTSYGAKGEAWFEGKYAIPSGKMITADNPKIGERLQQLFFTAKELKPECLDHLSGYRVETRLEFPLEWGLGSSSTLVSNLAAWLGVDPFLLLQRTFDGSGYDLACATAGGPILYQLQDGKPKITGVDFHPPFRENIYFVYLKKKQDSREGIQRYRERQKNKQEALSKIHYLTREIVQAKDLATFNTLIREHERIVAGFIDLAPVRSRLFPDFWGEVKSLGAWGGDFVLATSTRSGKDTAAYFNSRGFSDVIRYDEMVGGELVIK